MSNEIIETDKLNYAIFIEQEKYEWKCYLFGTKHGMILHTTKDKTPNMFWRIMQYIIFGNRWERIKDEKHS